MPVDIALTHGMWHRERIVVESEYEIHLVQGVETPYVTEEVIYLQPLWIDPARIAVPLLVLAILIARNKINRQDVGLTVGLPRTTVFWILVPITLAPVIVCLVLALAVALIRWTNSPLPEGLGETIVAPLRWKHGYVWREFWHACVLTPLFEDTLYRGILAPALERLGGFWFALLGSGVVWASLHIAYGWPITLSPAYFVFGILGCWVFLRARSLIPLFVLHALWNACVPFGHDLLVLRYPKLIPTLFEANPG